MDNRLKESLSAMMDDEANELEIHRLMSQSEETELRETWSRYHEVQKLLRDSEQEQQLPQFDISAGVREAIAQSEQESGQVASVDSTSSNVDNGGLAHKQPGLIYKAFSIAACAVLAVFAVINYQPETQSSLTAAIEQPEIDTQPFLSDEAYFVKATAHEEPRIIVEFSDEHARKFNEYLLRHAEHAAFSPASGVTSIARVASFNSVGP